MRNLLPALVFSLFFLNESSATTLKQNSIELPECSSHPCPNTSTGEELTEIDKKKDDARRKKLIETGQLKKLWATSWIFSDSNDAKALILPLTNRGDPWIRLDPAKGVIYFESKLKTHSFLFRGARGDKKVLCPKYIVKIIDGSANHVVIEKTCLLYEDPRKQFHMGVEYFLYDIESNTMLSLWSQEINKKNEKMPTPSNPPTVKRTASGYRLIWSATDPSDGSIITMNTKYYRAREPKSKEIYLGCTDLDAPKDEEHEGSCSGDFLTKLK